MRSALPRLGALLALATLAAACSNDSTSPMAPSATEGVFARGGSSSGGGGGGGGGGGSVTGPVYIGIVDSSKIVNVGIYYPSYKDVWYSGSHVFTATSAIKIHSSSDLPLGRGACAQFEYTVSAGREYVSDIKVLSAAKCGI